MTRWVTIGIVVAIAVLVVLTVTQRGREGLSCNDPTCGGEMQDKGLSTGICTRFGPGETAQHCTP